MCSYGILKILFPNKAYLANPNWANIPKSRTTGHVWESTAGEVYQESRKNESTTSKFFLKK
jgi:hypothetical protein